MVIHDAPAAEASAPNPDESPPTDPGADAASPEQPAPPPAQAAKKKKPKPPTIVAAPAPDAQPTAPFEPAPNIVAGGQRARALTLAAATVLRYHSPKARRERPADGPQPTRGREEAP